MSKFKSIIFETFTLLILLNGLVDSLDSNSEPDWSLVEERNLFQSSDNLVAGKLVLN